MQRDRLFQANRRQARAGERLFRSWMAEMRDDIPIEDLLFLLGSDALVLEEKVEKGRLMNTAKARQ